MTDCSSYLITKEYTDPDPTGLRTMILCRCTMGRAIKQYEGGRECMKAWGVHRKCLTSDVEPILEKHVLPLTPAGLPCWWLPFGEGLARVQCRPTQHQCASWIAQLDVPTKMLPSVLASQLHCICSMSIGVCSDAQYYGAIYRQQAWESVNSNCGGQSLSGKCEIQSSHFRPLHFRNTLSTLLGCTKLCDWPI